VQHAFKPYYFEVVMNQCRKNLNNIGNKQLRKNELHTGRTIETAFHIRFGLRGHEP
jgi:hypothetical protein